MKIYIYSNDDEEFENVVDIMENDNIDELYKDALLKWGNDYNWSSVEPIR